MSELTEWIASEVEEYDENKIYCTKLYFKSEVDKVLAEKDEKIARLEAMHKVHVEAITSMETRLHQDDKEIRNLKRALWVTRTAMAKSEKDRWDSHVDCGNKRNRKDPAFVKTGKLLEVSEWRKLWADNERKCRAKAEEYK